MLASLPSLHNQPDNQAGQDCVDYDGHAILLKEARVFRSLNFVMDFNQSAARKPRFIDIVVSHAAPRYVSLTIALNAPSLSNSVEQVLQLIPAASIFTCRRYYCHRMAAARVAVIEAPVIGARAVMQAGCGVA